MLHYTILITSHLILAGPGYEIQYDGKGRAILIHENHTFRIHLINKNQPYRYWRCRKGGCKARVIIQKDGSLFITADHNHQSKTIIRDWHQVNNQTLY